MVIELTNEAMVVGELTIRLVPEDGEAPTLIEGGEVAVGATVRVVGQVLAGNVLVATTVMVEIPAPPVDEEPEDDATPTPTPADEPEETPTDTPTPAADDETPTPTLDEETPTPTPDEGTPTPTPPPGEGTTTVTPTDDATPTPTVLPADVILVGLVEEVDEESVQIDGQVFQIVAGDGGTVVLVSLAIGDLVTVEARLLEDGTLVATLIDSAATQIPTEQPTPDPTITPVVDETPEDAAEAATG